MSVVHRFGAALRTFAPLTALSVIAAALLNAAAAHAEELGSPDGSAELRLEGVAAMHVDEARGYVLLTPGLGGTAAVITDLDGRVVSTRTDLAGAARVDPSQDGRRLWVALGDDDQILELDADSLEVLARYPTGEETCPHDLVDVGDVVVFTGSCAHTSATPGILVLDPRSGEVTPALGSTGQVELAQAAHAPVEDANDVYFSGYGYVGKISVDPGAPSLTIDSVAEVDDWRPDLAVAPDGSLVATRSGVVLSGDDLSVARSFPVSDDDARWGFTAMGPDDALAVSDRTWDAPQLSVFGPDGQPNRQYRLTPDGSWQVVPDGLVYASSGALYAITTEGGRFEDRTTVPARLSILHPESPATTVTLAADASSYRHGERATISARLDEPASGASVSFFADVRDGRGPQLVDTVLTDAEGVAGVRLSLEVGTIVSAEHVLPGGAERVVDELWVEPTARVRTQLIGEFAGKRVARYDESGSMRVRGTAVDVYDGACIGFTIQRKVRGRWEDMSRPRCELVNGPRHHEARLRGSRSLVGATLRVRAETHEDTGYADGAGPWRSFTFVH